MASLNTKPGSSTAKQRTTLVIVGKRTGLELNEIRKAVGGSISKLSAAQASEWIKHYSGSDLANPPGKKPGTYKRRSKSSATRIISNDQVEQIDRLSIDYFSGNTEAAGQWLEKNFDVITARQLATAERGGQVIAVLKTMHARRDQQAKHQMEANEQ